MYENTKNIAEWISFQATERPYQRALVFSESRDAMGRRAYTQLNFLQVESMINRFARGFQKKGIKKGDRVCVFVTLCLEFMPIVFALYKIGAIVVLIDPGMGRAGLLSCVQRIAPIAMVAVPKAMIATVLFPAKFFSVQIKITVGGGTWLWGGWNLLEVEDKDDSPVAMDTTLDDEASILFTSGSTGPAKGVRYTHRILDAQTRMIQEMYGIQGGEIDLPCFPLFGLFTLAQGMTVVIPDMDPTHPVEADPAVLVEAILEHGATSAFASPTLWKKIVRWCIENKVRLPTLRRVLSAGAPIPPQLHRDFQMVIAEGIQVHTPYGATESLPIASIASCEVLEDTEKLTNEGMGTCVGHIAPNIEVAIIQISDDIIETWDSNLLLSQGTIGEICVKGVVVTTEYKEEPTHTKASKIYQTQDGTDIKEVWHRMGDVGYIDLQGRLWFCGRLKHRVRLSTGETVYPVQVEAIINQDSDVERSALVGVHGQAVIIVQRKNLSTSIKDLGERILANAKKHPKTECVTKILFHDNFPVDVRHNAKIDRPALTVWAKNLR